MRRSLRWFGFVGAVACLLAGSPAAATPAVAGPTAIGAPVVAPPVTAPSAAAVAASAPVAQQQVSYDRYARYVTYVYEDLLGRQPDAGGLSIWVSALYGVPRIQVATSISSSREYREGLVRRAYDRYLNRVPDTAGLKNWADALDRGWTISTIESGFLASQEYYLRAGGTPAGWVRELYRAVLGRTAAPSEVDHWVRVLAGGYTRAQVALGFLLSTEHLTTVVDGYYVQLLDRHIDPAGRRTWVSALQAGRHDEEIIAGIIGSDEYWNRTATYPMSDLVLSPSAPEIAAGASQAFTVRALGRGDDLGDVTERAVVTIDGLPCPGAVCTATSVGVHVVQAALGETWTAVNLTVRPGPLDSVTLTPDGVTIADGASVVYAAQGFDAYGNEIGDVTSQVTFAVDGDTAACTAARCRPTAPGDHTVSAVGLEGHVTVSVSPPGPEGSELWGWGYGYTGLFGDTTASRLTPARIGSDTHWDQISAVGSLAIATKTDGSLWSWGLSTLCPGLMTFGGWPEQVGVETDWADVAASAQTVVGLKDDGTLWAWGDLSFGSIAPATFVCEPTQIGAGRLWSSVSLQYSSWAAIAQDGSLWMWGRNTNGQLGDGTQTTRTEPTFIDAGPWARVASSGNHTLALKSDGTIWAWGDNRNGRLGTGARVSSLVPVQVGTRSDWTSVTVTSTTSAAVDAAGVLWWWGGPTATNEVTLTDVLSPVVLDDSRPWSRLASTSRSRFMLASDGTLWGWGYNGGGQLGDGTTTNAVLAAVQAGSGGGWSTVVPTGNTTLALRDPGAAP